MTAYEILKRLSPYELLIKHLATEPHACTCKGEITCTNCHLHKLVDELDDIFREVGEYVF